MKKTITLTALFALTTSGAFAFNTQACAACHGAHFEKKAMNVSKVVKDLSKDEIVTALKGYRDNPNYGGAMKTVMQGQAKKLSDADIEAIATQIAGGDKDDKNATANDVTGEIADKAKDVAADVANEAADKAKDAAMDKAKDAASSMLK